MNTEDIPTKQLSNWVPEENVQIRKVLGKLGEEVNELGNIICRILIQGIDGIDPETGVPNKIALANEIADVEGMCQAAKHYLNMDHKGIAIRAQRKFEWKKIWFEGEI